MSKVGLEVDIEKTFEQFADLTAQQMTFAIKKALNKAAVELRQLTTDNFLSSGIRQHSPDSKYNDSMEEGVMMKKAKGSYDEDFYSIVHIMGSRATGSGTFRLRFYEKGTKDRYQQSANGKPLSKPKYIGSIKPKWFFKSANSQIESSLDRIYMEEIDKAIEKINKRQK